MFSCASVVRAGVERLSFTFIVTLDNSTERLSIKTRVFLQIDCGSILSRAYLELSNFLPNRGIAQFSFEFFKQQQHLYF